MMVWFLPILLPCASVFAAGPSTTLSTAAVSISTPSINVVYPTEGETLPTLKNQWIIGSVSDPKTLLKINGQDVPVYKTGAFISWLPVSPGTFTFHCEAGLGASTAAFDRTVSFEEPLKPLADRPVQISTVSLEPRSDEGLKPGDWLTVRMQATKGVTAEFSLPGRSWTLMRETDRSLGLYEGVYQVGPGESLRPSYVLFRAGGFWGARAKSRGKVSFDSSRPRVVQVSAEDPVSVKTEPGRGERFSLLPQTKFVTAGFSGPYVKAAIDPSWIGWVDAKAVRALPEGTAPPSVEIQTIATHAGPRGAKLSISMSEPVPFTVEENPSLQTLTVRLYNSKEHVNWIVYDPADSFVDQVEATQESSQVVRLKVQLKAGQILWGWHAEFGHQALDLELRSPPVLAKAPASALKGISVFLDPGHMPSASGATGPLGTREMDVNFEIAQALSSLLTAAGARVVLSRQSDSDEVSLVQRPVRAWQEQADLYVSIHNNNLSDGEDPFASAHGYSVFYYNPHSLSLAREIYRRYQKEVPLPDEDLRFGDLYVLRTTEMPAVLTESAYLSLPEQEALLLSSEFRAKLAGAMEKGLASFLERERARQERQAGQSQTGQGQKGAK